MKCLCVRVCLWMNVCGDINKTKAYLPSVVFAGGTRIVRYWNMVAWMMFGGNKFRTKSRSVSAVRTTLVVALPFMLPTSLPEPGRSVLTRMMPSTTAQIVVVK